MKKFFSICFLVLAFTTTVCAKDFYAVLNGNCLTLLYDNAKSTHDEGMVIDYMPYSDKQLWSDVQLKSRVKSIVIDKSIRAFLPTSTRNWFCDLDCLVSISGLNNLNTKNVTSMERMFYGCKSLESLDLSAFDTKFVTNMDGMFLYCTKLEVLDLSGFDTRNVTTMKAMFCNCRSLKTIVFSPRFVTRNVENMSAMFSLCESLVNLDLTSFDPVNLKATDNMFTNCSELRSIYVNEDKKWNPDTSEQMFIFCYKLEGGTGRTYSQGGWDAALACVKDGLFTGMYPTQIALNASGVRLSKIGETRQMNCRLVNEIKVKYGSVTWTSDNPRVVSVDTQGLVTAVSEGVANITATSADGVQKATASFRVDTSSYAEKISLDQNVLSFYEINGTPKSLTATLSPGNVTRNKITWTSSNPQVASVNPQGLVFAQGYGTTVITASVPRGYSDTNEMLSDLTATCTVTVKEAEAAPRVRPWSVSFPQTDYYLSLGKTCDLGLIIVEKYATDFTVTSTMPQVVEVSADGKSITAKEIGNARLVVQWTDPDGNVKTAMARVEVR